MATYKKRRPVPTAASLKAKGEYGYEPVKSRGEYEQLGEVVSKKDPNKVWKIFQHKTDGRFKCSCPAYIFRGDVDADGNRTCKHLEGSREQAAAAGMGLREYLLAQNEVGAAKASTEARVEAIRKVLVAAAERVEANGARTLRALLFERQWRELAEMMLPGIDALAPRDLATVIAPTATPSSGSRRLRRIELD